MPIAGCCWELDAGITCEGGGEAVRSPWPLLAMLAGCDWKFAHGSAPLLLPEAVWYRSSANAPAGFELADTAVAEEFFDGHSQRAASGSTAAV
jgi:hypothetical protein